MATDENVEIVVLTALPLEYAAVRAHLVGLQRRSHPLGTQFEVGTAKVGPGRVAIAEIGEGNVDAALVASQAIDTFRPKAAFFVGVAGALRDDLDLGDVVVATRVYAYHGGKEKGTEFLARPRSFEADHELEQRARYVSRAFQARPNAPTVHFRPIAAGEVVLDSRESAHARNLREHYGDAVAVEMESAGMAQAALMSRTRVLTVRGISDHADGKKALADGTGSQLAAARNAADLAFAVVGDFLAAASAVVGAAPGPQPQPASTQIVAGIGAPAFGALHGNVHFHGEAVSPQPGWRLVEPMPDVVWRSDVVRRNGILESPALEFHVVPVENLGRLPVLRLRDLAVELAETGRKAGTFTPAEQLTIEADASRALALGSGPSGLLVTRSGQRSMWHPLPSDTLGALLDEEWVAEQLERMIVVLRDLTLPVPDRWATAVGIAPAATVTPGKVSSIPRSRATFGFDRREVVRVPPDESVAPADLSHRAVAVAAELAARLVAAFG